MLETAVADAARTGRRAVVLTTDRDLPWNRPFYERVRFRVLDRDECAPWIVERLAYEAGCGHDPARRCAMLRPLQAFRPTEPERETNT